MGSFNSKNKLFIRENWNKPLLQFLSQDIDEKLIYLGLPSSNAEDILQWVEYIKMVIAFQCRSYPTPSLQSQPRTEIEKLNVILQRLEREKKIDNYLIFDGYLEEVILRGFDNSPSQLNFGIKEFITLYNLDFCNRITSPLIFKNRNGEIEEAYKFNAINKLLEIQKSINTLSKKFILFLTVHCSYSDKVLLDFIKNPPSNEIKMYIKKYSALSGYTKDSRVVRLFVCYILQLFCNTFGFSTQFLPVIIYKGLQGHMLMHFSVLGIKVGNTVGGVPVYQPLLEIIKQGFLSVNDGGRFKFEFIKNEEAFSNESNPVKIFSESKSFKEKWIIKN